MNIADPDNESLSQSLARALNQGCHCHTLDSERLRQIMEHDAPLQGQMQHISLTRPHLFSSTAVFLSEAVAQTIEQAIGAIERVIALPGYGDQALARAPTLAHRARGPRGVCMGYDFHWSPQGLKLIEINTNAGGLLLNAGLARAQQSCCEAMTSAFKFKRQVGSLESSLIAMFASEWALQRGKGPLGTVAIVDDDPQAQYLAPEFELFKSMFMRHGIQAVIADPKDLVWQNGVLYHRPAGEQAPGHSPLRGAMPSAGNRPDTEESTGQVVDLVYNRLTDFYLEEPAHAALRQAFEAGAVVLTPDPHAHALFADKRNLIALSQPDLLAAWGASAQDQASLAAVVPATRLVRPEDAADLWARRKQFFFKPVAGYGAKAAYRGDKLTKRVWAEILAGSFVAQELVPPGERSIKRDGVVTDLKFDIRAYTYAGQVQLLAARMYSGQTTNFRTEGGGFAPVMVVPQ